ncbi:MAG: amino acid permease [Sphingomonadales bacterium]|jgi:amino acid transporter
MGQLKRRLGFWLLTSYGVGTTLGAGIYVLVGEIAGVAGYYAPLSFLLAGLLAFPSGLAFAELSARYPKSAGPAVFVSTAFKTPHLALVVGLLVAASGVVSSATLLNGMVGYLNNFIQIKPWLTIVTTLIILSLICIWGIKESIGLAAFITAIEAGALILIAGLGADLVDFDTVITASPSIPFSALGLISGGLIAFYAFIGFEDIASVAEEVIDVKRNIPKAIIATLIITCLLYICVSFTAVFAVGPKALSEQSAPLAYVFSKATAINDTLISLIAILAIINGVLIQIVMASRILYGMAEERWVPSILGEVNAKRGTPVNATILVTIAVAVFALLLPLVRLAQITSSLILIIFFIINLALWRIKMTDPDFSGFQIPKWVLIWGMSGAAFLIFANIL